MIGVVHAGHVDAAAGLPAVPELRARVWGDRAAVALGAGSPDLDDAARSAVYQIDRDVSRAPRRRAVAFTLVALSTVSWAAGVARGQQPPSDSGQADPGESASAWHGVVAFLGWILLAVVVFGLLVWMVLGARRRPSATSPDARGLLVPRRDRRGHAASKRAAKRTPRNWPSSPSITRRAPNTPTPRLAGARTTRRGFVRSRSSSATATVGSSSAEPSRAITLTLTTWRTPWGTDTAVGAVAGAVVGLTFGPPGFAAGLVAGGTAGGLRESTHAPEERGALFDEIRRDIPEGASGVVALVGAEDSDALIAALHDRAVRVTRHRLSAAEGAALHAAVAQAPHAATPDV